jgi:hypothetical protein
MMLGLFVSAYRLYNLDYNLNYIISSLFSFFATARVAVVTGGNRGIGLEICRQLASSGVTVVLTARDAERGAEAASTLGLPNVVFHQLDVGDPSSAARLAGFIEEKFGRLDILVCHGRLISRSSCSCDLAMRSAVHYFIFFEESGGEAPTENFIKEVKRKR